MRVRWPRLAAEGRVDGVEDAGDAAGQSLHRDDGRNRDQDDDERVLDQTLALFLTLDAEPIENELHVLTKHFRFPPCRMTNDECRTDCFPSLVPYRSDRVHLTVAMLGSATLFQNHQMAASPHGTSVLDSIRGYRSPPISIFLACLRQISALTRPVVIAVLRFRHERLTRW